MKDEDFNKVLQAHRERCHDPVFLPDHQFKQLTDNPMCISIKVGCVWYMRECDMEYYREKSL